MKPRSHLNRLTAITLISLCLIGAVSFLPVLAQTTPDDYIPYNSSLVFVENQGQFDSQVLFQARSAWGDLWLTRDSIWVTVESGSDDAGVALRITLEGASNASAVEPFGRLAGTFNYYTGKDSDNWHTGVPGWSGVRYRNIYQGIDLEVTGAREGWAWVLLANENNLTTQALPDVAVLVDGAQAILSEGNGLVAQTAIGDISLPPLGADMSGSSFTIASVSQAVSLPFVATEPANLSAQQATPGLLYSTFLGGAANDRGMAMASDGLGSVFVAGYSASTDFPTTPGVYQPAHGGGYDAFVAKLNTSNNSLTYATFVGGTRYDYGRDTGGVTVDLAGNAYLVGWTDSPDFPTTAGAFESTLSGSYDAFALKLSANGGTLLYSTLIGGTSADYARAIAVDASGNAYLAGQTLSDDFPTTTGAYQTAFGGGPEGDGFACKLSPTGGALLYSTYLGGGADDWITGLDRDSQGNVFLVGQTSSADFPVSTDSYSTVLGGATEAFVTKLSASGTAIIYSTYIGGSGLTFGRDIVADNSGNTYITGYTGSVDFPVSADAYQDAYGGGAFDAFVARLNDTGTALDYASFLGGSGDDYARAITRDNAANLYLAGGTFSTDFPATGGAYDTTHNGGEDAFALKLSSPAWTLVYATLLGGSSDEAAFALALDHAGNLYLTGDTFSVDFPTTITTHDATYNGGDDAFVSKLLLGSVIYLPAISNE